MVTGAAKPPRTVPESARVANLVPQVMIAAPAGFTARPTAWACVPRVFTFVQRPPAGRLAVSMAPRPPTQAAIAFPDPSMPTTGAPSPPPTSIGVLHWPPGGRTLAATTSYLPTTHRHTATARPSGAIATAGLVPWARVTGADQACPSALVQTWTDDPLPPAFWPNPAATCAPAALTATDPPHEPGSWTGGDQEPAACAGSATAVPVPSAISKAGSARAPPGMNRDMTKPFYGLRGFTPALT